MLFCRNIINLLVVPSLAAAAIDIDHQSAVAVANTNSDEDNNNNKNNRAKDKVDSNRILSTNLFARSSSSSGKSKRSDNSNGKSGKKRPKNRKSKTDKGSTSKPSQYPTTVTFRIQSCGLACPPGYTGSQPLDGCTGFVGCDNGVAAAPIACPPGLLYDNDGGECNFPELVTCNCGTSPPPSTQTPTVKPSLLPNDSPRIISVTVVEPGGVRVVNCCDDGGSDECSDLLLIGQVESPEECLQLECFGANDGGQFGVLYKAVRSYVSQGCANNKECDIGRVYGWPINSWCVDNVRDMSSLFRGNNNGMIAFNEDISDWDTSSVINMRQMFAGASSFNRNLLNFDTSRVTNMYYMFEDARSFNGDVSSFNTSSVTDMYGMFEGAKAFNGDVSNFDTSRVTSMEGMFYEASSFNRDLCSWRDSFPYTNAFNIFGNSNCTYQDTPNKTQKGPFCASNCQ